MFVRINSTPNSPRKSIQIVESVRTGDKVKQKILRYVGIAMNDYEQERLIALANDIIAKMKEEQREPELFNNLKSEDNKLGRKKKKHLADILPADQVALTDVREESRIIEGVDDIAGIAYDELGFNKLLLRGSNQLLKDVVLARLVYPYSKRKLQQVMSKHFDKEYDLHKIYYLMDQIYPKIDRIKQLTQAKTRSLMPSADVVLFDVTTLHFESVNSDGLREFGYSKSFRFNTTQVVLALATNEHGLPLGYELFEGNMAEVKTLLKSLNKWKELFDIKSVCFVADRAMFSKENLTLLDASGYEYVVAAKLRSLSDEMQEQILDGKNYRLEQVRDEVMWTGCFKHKADMVEKFMADNLTLTRDEKQQLRDIYTVLALNNDPLAEEIKENLLCKLRAKSITLAQEFKDKLLSHPIFLSGASSNKLIVSYRSARAFNDQHKRELILKKLKSKTGKVEKVINAGARKYLSVNAVEYHFIKSKTELVAFLDDQQQQHPDDTVAFVVHAPESELKVFMSKPSGIKHIVVISAILFNEVHKLTPALNLAVYEELGKTIGINKQLVDGSISAKEIKKVLNRQFKDYLPNVSTYVDENKIHADSIWDGMHGIVTNIKNKEPHELINKYHNLWRIEEAFRINKHNLKMRPVYHWAPQRIHAHIAMCYMAFAVLKLIQYKVALTQPKYSVIDVIETMLSVQSSIHVHKKTKDKYKLPGSMSYKASALYKAFGVHRDLDASIYQ
jgi:transposase